jgi:hypothetical protein
MADTKRFTGTGRLNNILDAIACWRIKLLQTKKKENKARVSIRASVKNKETPPNLKTRASDVSPAMAIPT